MRFDGTDDLRGATFEGVDLAGARFRNVDLTGARFSEAMLVNARLSGLIEGLVVNDVEVAPLIVAELDRRYPERVKLRPADADGAREAWATIEGLWAPTMARAGRLPDATRRAQVDGEWSFEQTLRHLVFVTDLWIGQPVLGWHGRYHRCGLPPTFMTDVEAYGIDPAVEPPYAEVVAARDDRIRVVRDPVTGLRDDDLDRPCGHHTLLICLGTVLDEEWHHHWYATRDLDVLDPG